MRTRWLGLALLAVCAPAAYAQKGDPPLKDTEILQKVYDKSYTVPKDFCKDPALTKPDYSLYYHQPGWFADDKDAARKIVQDFLDKPSNIAVRKIEEANETRRSFDFRGGTIWYRVHKPSYFAWQGKRVGEYNASLPATGEAKEIGKLKVKPLSKEAVQEFAEYEWLLEYYNLGGAKVLTSEVKGEGGKLVCTLWTTQVTYGDFGLQDEIRVVRVTYTVDPKDGSTTKGRQTVKTLRGKKN